MPCVLRFVSIGEAQEEETEGGIEGEIRADEEAIKGVVRFMDSGIFAF